MRIQLKWLQYCEPAEWAEVWPLHRRERITRGSAPSEEGKTWIKKAGLEGGGRRESTGNYVTTVGGIEEEEIHIWKICSSGHDSPDIDFNMKPKCYLCFQPGTHNWKCFMKQHWKKGKHDLATEPVSALPTDFDKWRIHSISTLM